MKKSQLHKNLLNQEKDKKVFMYNRNINEKELTLLKKQGKFSKCPYHAPQGR